MNIKISLFGHCLWLYKMSKTWVLQFSYVRNEIIHLRRLHVRFLHFSAMKLQGIGEMGGEIAK